MKVGKPGLSDSPRVGGPVEMFFAVVVGGFDVDGRTDAGVGHVGGEGTGSAVEGVCKNDVTGCNDTKW